MVFLSISERLQAASDRGALTLVPKNSDASALREILAEFGLAYKALIEDYNNAVKSGAAPDRSALLGNRDALVQSTRDALSERLSKVRMASLNDYVMKARQHMKTTSIASGLRADSGTLQVPDYTDYWDLPCIAGDSEVPCIGPGLPFEIEDILDGSATFDCAGNQCQLCTDVPVTVSTFQGGNTWTSLAGGTTPTQVSVSSDGTLWGIDANGKTWNFNQLAQTWTQMSSTPKMSDISVGSMSNVWALDASGKPYQYNFSNSTSTSKNGSLKQISIAADGTIWGVDVSQKVWEWGGSAWNSMPGTLVEVAVGAASNIWGLNSTGAVFSYSSTSGSWTTEPGTLAHIAVASDRTVVGINASNQVLQWNGATWSQITGQALSSITAGSHTDIMGSSGGTVFHYLPTYTSSSAGQPVFPTTYISQIASSSVHNLSPGSSYSSTGMGEVESPISCGGPMIYSADFDLQIEIAVTLLKMSPTQVPPNGTCETNNGVTECQYGTMSWCTSATTPPDYNPSGVQGVFPAEYPTYWPAYALCERLGPGVAWSCVGGTPNGYSAPDNYPQYACTKSQ
jgi:virginiamycin B lyase